MKGARSPRQPLVQFPAGRAENLVRRLTDNSLVFYLVTAAAGRAWLVLNTDVQDLLRRMH